MQRFGPFEVDIGAAEMRKSGLRVRIQEQPLRILEMLLERRGELVSREELRGRLWPADTFVDFERSLNAAVGKLRQSLNDSADRPLYIETVARKGYRFIAPVTESKPEQLPVAEPDTPPESPPPRPRRLRWVVAGALAAAVVLLWVAFRMPRDDSERRVVWLDLDVGSDVSQPALSPDGMTLVFIANGRLALRRLDQPRITPLGETDGASSPFFSPDGRWVGYFANRKLRKIAVEGGQSITLCDAPIDRGATWTEDGQIIAALSASGGLSNVPASGGRPRPVGNFEGEPPEVTSHRGPVALPRGKGILFISGAGIAAGSIRALPPDGSRAKTLIENASSVRYVASGYLLFYRSGTIFAAPLNLNRLELGGPPSPLIEGVAHDHFRGADFDVSASGTLVYRRRQPLANRAVTLLDSSGVETRVFAKTGEYTSPRMSPDGRRLALTSGSQVWIHDLARGTMTRLTFGSRSQCCPIWSPDGDYLVFASQDELTWARWDGSGAVERLPTARATSSVPFSFSPDGKWLAFHRNSPQTGYDVWAAPVDRTGGALRLGAPQPLVRQAGLQTAPAISPDGRWLAYGSDDETGRIEIYVIPFSPQGPPPEGKRQVSTDGGRGPQWSYNQGEIYFRAPNDSLMAAAITAKDRSFQADKPRLWSAKRLSVVGAQPNYSVAPDGKRIVALFDAEETKQDETHLRVLFNVNAELRRQRANLRK